MNLADMLGQGPAPTELLCSRKGCRQPASWQLLWNNPKIHTPERRKAWLACDDHVAWLEDYLRGRGLWKQTLALDSQSSTDPVEGQ